MTTPETDTTEAPAPVVTEPPESEFDPVIGGKLVVAGEAEAANPWTPANVQCDSYCQMRVRAFYDPLVTVDDELDGAAEPRREHHGQRGLDGLHDQGPRGHHVPRRHAARRRRRDGQHQPQLPQPPHRRRREGRRPQPRRSRRRPGQPADPVREDRRLHVHDVHRLQRRSRAADPVADVPDLPHRPGRPDGLADMAGRRRRRHGAADRRRWHGPVRVPELRAR